MRCPRPQDVEEREALSSILAKIRNEWGFVESFGLIDLLKKWEKFVQDVEHGYALSIYDFTHSLAMRDLLEEIKGAVSIRFRKEISTAIEPWDEQFMRATMPSDRPIEIPSEENAAEWWFRIPHMAGPELTGYLLSEGLLGKPFRATEQ